MNLKRLREIHRHSFRNAEEIKASKLCGCFYCCKIFDAKEVTDIHIATEKSGGATAWCPHCNIDALIGDASGIKINQYMLSEMHKAFF
jgi:hypothetical protein